LGVLIAPTLETSWESATVSAHSPEIAVGSLELLGASPKLAVGK